MHRNTSDSPRTEKDWFNVSPAPHHSDKGTVSTITMKEDSLRQVEIQGDMKTVWLKKQNY